MTLPTTATVNSGIIDSNISGKTLTIAGTLANKGTVEALTGAKLTISNPGTFTNTGNLGAYGSTITLAGAFKAGTGKLTIGIGGTGQGTTYGLINVQYDSPHARRNAQGHAHQQLHPRQRQPSFTPLKYTSKTGSFTTSTLVSGTTTFVAAYSSTALTLTIKPVVVATGETLAMTYTEVEIANDVNFTSGVQDITLNNTGTNSVSIKAGQYFEFGIDAQVTGNANPAFNDAWDKANQALGNPAQPANLGLGVIAMLTSTTNGATTVMAPVTVPNGKSFPLSTAIVGPQNYPALPQHHFTTGSVSGGNILAALFQTGGGYVRHCRPVGSRMGSRYVGGLFKTGHLLHQYVAFHAAAARQDHHHPACRYDRPQLLEQHRSWYSER